MGLLYILVFFLSHLYEGRLHEIPKLACYDSHNRTGTRFVGSRRHNDLLHVGGQVVISRQYLQDDARRLSRPQGNFTCYLRYGWYSCLSLGRASINQVVARSQEPSGNKGIYEANAIRSR